MRFTVTLAALLFLSACTESAPVSVNSPEFTTVPPENPSPPPPPPPKPDPSETAGCTKATPPPEGYADRPAQCVEISGPTSLNVGSGQTLTCSGWGHSPGLTDWYPVSADRPRTWLSGDQSIVSVSQTNSASATITGVSPGSTWVSCQIDQAVASVTITVLGTRTLASMFILPNSLTLQVGNSDQVAVQFVDNYGQVNKIHPTVDEWASDNTPVATVAPEAFGGQVARVTAVGTPSPTQNGAARVRARVGTMWSSWGNITVQPAPRVTSVTVSPTSATMSEFTYATLTATAFDQFGRAMSGRAAFWSTDNQSVLSLSNAGAMQVYAQGVHWGSANVFVQVDGVAGNTVPITVYTEGNISGYYVTSLSPWGDPFTSAGTYDLTPTTSTPGTPPITYKWEITYSDNSRPPITTGYQSGPYPLAVHDGAYKIYVTVTPRQAYGAGYPTNWTYNVCTGGGGGGGGKPPLAVARNSAGISRPAVKPNSGGSNPYRVVYGCSGPA